MSMLKEFKEFALRGNVVDVAVGIIIGGAFGKIITSLVNNILMPPIGLLLGGSNFSELSFVLQEASATSKAVMINYGAFIQSIIDFIIIAFCIFILIKGMNKMKKKQEVAPAKPPKQEVLLEEIRDLLSKKS